MTRPPRPARPDQSGVTLVEVLVALVIFSIIGVAGYAMLDLVARSDRLTEGRLQRLGQMQRAMYLIQQDFHLAEGRSVTTLGTSVTLRRAAEQATGGEVTLTYALTGDSLSRQITDTQGRVVATQILLAGVTAVDWRYLADGTEWLATWPPDEAATLSTLPPENPHAVALTLSLADEGKLLRRVAVLPAAVP